MRLTESVWSPEQLVQIARHAGAVTVAGLHQAAAVERMVPGTMPFPYRHPWVFGWAVAISVVVVVIAAVLGFFIATDRPPFDDRPPAATSAAADPAVVGEHDAGKGWMRSATIGRSGGNDLTAGQLDDLADELVGIGFAADLIERRHRHELQVWSDGGTSPELAVIGHANGDIWVNLAAACVAG